jgi:hypothetical protein
VTCHVQPIIERNLRMSVHYVSFKIDAHVQSQHLKEFRSRHTCRHVLAAH